MRNSEILRKAKGLIDTPERWLHGPDAYGRDSGGVVVTRCIGCALMEAENVLSGRMWFESRWMETENLRAMFSKYAGVVRVPDFNKDPKTTHADVMSAFDRAIALAEADERKDEPQRKPWSIEDTRAAIVKIAGDAVREEA